MRAATLVVVALLALLLGPAGCGVDAEVEGPAVVAAPVMVAPVEAHRVLERIQAAGELIAKEEATVSSEVGGVVTEILVDEGKAVEKGTLVLEIDPERRELELRSRQAGVSRAEAGLREQLRAVDERFFEQAKQTCRQLMAELDLDEGTIAALSRMILSVLDGLSLNRMLGHPDDDYRASLELFQRMLASLPDSQACRATSSTGSAD